MYVVQERRVTDFEAPKSTAREKFPKKSDVDSCILWLL